MSYVPEALRVPVGAVLSLMYSLGIVRDLSE